MPRTNQSFRLHTHKLEEASATFCGRLLSFVHFFQIAIIEYLDETRPSPPLLPSDPKDKVKVGMATMHLLVSSLLKLMKVKRLNSPSV